MLKKPLILIVDNEESSRNLCSRIAGNVGYEPKTAANGQEALNYLADNMPNVVLMDYDMPIMNGLQTLAEMNKLYSDLSVLRMTGEPSPEREENLKNLGAKVCFQKPFEMYIVMYYLKQYLD